MVIYLIFICLLIFIPCKLQLRGINSAYLSTESCNAIKGTLFASHFANAYGKAYAGFWDTSYLRIKEIMGQCVVAHFLFYSGYGVMVSAKNKGEGYVREFPKKRILRTLLIYDCSQILFLLLQLWRGKQYDVRQFISAFLAWSSFGNDNWYIFVIISLYIISWLVLKNGGPNRAGAVKITIGTLALMLLLICAQKQTWWYNTMLCYALGAWYFVFQKRIEETLQKNTSYFCAVGLIALVYIFAHKFWNRNLAIYTMTVLAFTLLLVLITMKFQIRNRFLNYCGKHLQGLFLLHRLPMIFLGDFPFFQNNLYFFFAAMVISTFLLEFIFDRLVQCMKEGNGG